VSHPVPGQTYYCEDCQELLEDGPHRCIHVTGNIYA